MTFARALVIVLAVALAACGGEATCPRDMPSTCPPTPPSYKTDVAPIIETYCNGCHSPTGQASDKPLQTYDQVFGRRASVVSFVYGCQMPPPDFPQPTEPERVTLLTWLGCGAPNN